MDNDTMMLSLFAVFDADSTFLVLFLLQKHVSSLNQTNPVFMFPQKNLRKNEYEC